MQIRLAPDRRGFWNEFTLGTGTYPIAEITGNIDSTHERKGILPGIRTDIKWSIKYLEGTEGSSSSWRVTDATARWLVFEHVSLLPPVTKLNLAQLSPTPTGFTGWEFNGHGIISTISAILFMLGTIGMWIGLDALKSVGKRLREFDATQNPSCPQCGYPLLQGLCPECGYRSNVTS